MQFTTVPDSGETLRLGRRIGPLTPVRADPLVSGKIAGETSGPANRRQGCYNPAIPGSQRFETVG
ncbi:MAG: hypothetical protein KJO18_05530, partial [Acidimicrobiia bacterium]|nr:hypothetical protein [Acidimicrobiia bacterium]